MAEIQKIAIFVPDSEAKLFIEFQKHYDLFTLLLEKDVFKQKNAAITLNFDNTGSLQAIERRDFLYSVRHDKKVTHMPISFPQKDMI